MVGSRNVGDELVVYTRKIGGLTATAGRTLVSGGARGVDDAAMRGALDADGCVVGVIPDSLEAKVLHRANRNSLLNDRLVLISPYDPSSRFNVGHAMQRNKLLYALADAVLVVNADLNKGGTWAGATEQLDNLRLAPIYVRSTGTPSEGLNALVKKGALLWPNPNDADGLDAVLNVDFSKPHSAQEQNEISFVSDQQKTTGSVMTPNPPPILQTVQGANSEDGNSSSCPANDLFQVARTSILRIAGNPRTAAEIASELALTTPSNRNMVETTRRRRCARKAQQAGTVYNAPSSLIRFACFHHKARANTGNHLRRSRITIWKLILTAHSIGLVDGRTA